MNNAGSSFWLDPAFFLLVTSGRNYIFLVGIEQFD